MISLFRKGKTTRASFIINTLGMGVAIAAIYILMVIVNHMFTINKGLPDHKNILMMSVPTWGGEGRMTSINRPLAERIIADVPEIEIGGEVGPFGTAWRSYNFQAEGEHGSGENGFPRHVNVEISMISEPAVKILGVEFLQGTWADMKDDISHLAVSESAAKKFGLQVGDIFQENDNSGKIMREVVAIYKDFPKNTDFERYAMLCDIGNTCIDDWGEGSFAYCVKPAAGLTAEDVSRAANARIERAIYEPGFFPNWLNFKASNEEEVEFIKKQLDFRFVPIADMFFSQTRSNFMQHGSKVAAYAWIIIALLILFVAVINYVNMFFALVPVKIRSINTRKILGSSRLSLTASVVSEAVVMTLFSIAVAFVLVLFYQSTTYARLIGIDSAIARNVGIAVLTAIGAIVVAVGSSLYPALYITSFEPAFALKANFGASQTGRTLRYTLVGVQFVVAIAFVIISIFIGMQGRFMLNHDMGFDRENIVVAKTSNKIASSPEAFEAALRQNPQVKDVAWGDGNLVVAGRMSWGRMINGEQCQWEVYPCSWNMLDFLGIEIVEGRNFAKSDIQNPNGAFIYNETARNQFGLTLDTKIVGHNNYTDIVGFCKDFNFKPMSLGIVPFCFYLWNNETGWRPCTTLFVRTNRGADISEVFDLIQNKITDYDASLTAEDINVHLFDTELENLYRDIKNMSKLTWLLSYLTIIISMLGVFGLVLFETEYRRKEIGIRRVNGATIADILRMFNKRYIIIVLVCFGVAAPISWVSVVCYLQQFAYRTPMHLWVFLVALLAVLTLTVVIVTLRSLRTATSDPVESLRTE